MNRLSRARITLSNCTVWKRSAFTFGAKWARTITTSSAYPTIPTCPSPKCSCQDMPSDLEIDRTRQLLGSVAPYLDHVLITQPGIGADEWLSKIEDDTRYPLVRGLKNAVKTATMKGLRANLLITASSFDQDGRKAEEGEEKEGSTIVSIMKAGLQVTVNHDADAIDTFSEDFVNIASQGGWSKEDLHTHFAGRSDPIGEVTVLICGHHNRDIRCGVMGPLLAQEFRMKLKQADFEILEEPGSTQVGGSSIEKRTANIGLISHIGGHAFAGNVIIYIPQIEQYQGHPLAGKGVWYGRVEPKHVEGIVEKTVDEGVVIQELLRGVV